MDASILWSRINKRGPDDCWPWVGGLSKCGYGRYWTEGKNWQAHRLVWTLQNGDPGNALVRHICEDRYERGDKSARLCCNTAHMVLGTHGANMQDMKDAGHSPRLSGEANSHAKLTKAQRDAVFVLRKAGMTLLGISDVFGVHKTTIERILNGKRWNEAHVLKHAPTYSELVDETKKLRAALANFEAP